MGSEFFAHDCHFVRVVLFGELCAGRIMFKHPKDVLKEAEYCVKILLSRLHGI